MTKKHFEAIAKAIQTELQGYNILPASEAHRAGYRDGVVGTAHAIATVCAESNPNFNRERFLKACGV